MRPRELVSAAAAAAATAAAPAATWSQTGSSLSDSVIALGELARSAPMRRSSQDSGIKLHKTLFNSSLMEL